jgi:hypothetical protein
MRLKSSAAGARTLHAETIEGAGALQIPVRLRYPGFPVKSCGFGRLHAALFTESCIRGPGESRAVGNSGSLRSG